jgi:hypothetical protein
MVRFLRDQPNLKRKTFFARGLEDPMTPRPSIICIWLIAVGAMAAVLSSDVRGQEPDTASLEAYLKCRLGPAYAREFEVDRRLVERARKIGAPTNPDTRLEEERLAIAAKNATGQAQDVDAFSTRLGFPAGAFSEELSHRAWRRSLAAEIVRAERPAPDPAALARAFEERYGPGGVLRTYRHILLSTDPLQTRAYTEADLARDTPAVKEAQRTAAEALVADLRAGKVRPGAPSTGGAHFESIDVAGSTGDLAGRLAAIPPNTPTLVEARTAYAVIIVERRISPARLEAVKMTVLPKPGELPSQTRARAEAAARALATAEDPAMYSLSESDDPEDQRTGGVIRLGAGLARSPSEGPAPALPEGMVDALAALEPKAATGLFPWKKGYAFAVLTGKQAASGATRYEGRIATFPFDERAVRAATLGPRLGELAAERAAGLLARVKRGEDMGRLAADESDDPLSAPSGGLQALFNALTYGDEFVLAISNLAPGGDPAVIRSNLGYHVIRCESEVRTRYEDVAESMARSIREAMPTPDEIDALLKDLGGS